jgi:hypothetical protein
VSTDISEEHIASIFRVEKQVQQETSVQAGDKHIFSTLKMDVTCSSETSVDIQQTTRRYIPEDGTHKFGNR